MKMIWLQVLEDIEASNACTKSIMWKSTWSRSTSSKKNKKKKKN